MRFGQGAVPCDRIGAIRQIGCSQYSAVSTMLSLARVARSIWWFTVSNAVDRSSRIKTDERDKDLAAWSDSVTARRAVSVECAVLKPD